MTLEYLRYFVTVAQKLNFTKAAEECHIAQTAMSRCIASLENEVGVMLIKRDRRSVSLTSAGEAFCRSAGEILTLYERGLEQARQMALEERRVLRIGIGPFARDVAFQLAQRSQERHPTVRMRLEHCAYEEMPDLLKQGRLDVGVFLPRSIRYLQTQGFKVLSVTAEKNGGVVFSQKHRFANIPESEVTCADISEEILLTTSSGDGPTSLENYKKVLAADGVVPKELLPVNSFETEMLMVQEGAGVALVPWWDLPEIPRGLCVKRAAFSSAAGFILGYWPDRLTQELACFLDSVKQDIAEDDQSAE